ncbi:hypothetical protein ANO11243_082600 [Dothideomycetidae sp. 11243]|nr:hypothetical protein ANO11243_082600 [fungal sp. No.11243]
MRIPASLKEWIQQARDFRRADFVALRPSFMRLDAHLIQRTFIVDHSVTIVDIVVYATVRGNRFAAAGLPSWTNVQRWVSYLEASSVFIHKVRDELNAHVNRWKSSSDGSAALANLAARGIKGQIVTRFPPEPSGFLHIGHAKAALLNYTLARDNGGTFICRFDDTDPSKETAEFQDAIREDLRTMGIEPDRVTYSSDYFEQMHSACVDMIKSGKAYADNTDWETMKSERKIGIASQCRDKDVDFSLAKFEAMRAGTDEGQQWCIRARISVDNPNKCLRDPVIYRCNAQPHHRTGTLWKVYPTYDFCVPFVDAVEGITLALRTTEYNDRNAQYAWIQAAMCRTAIPVHEFSRLSFVNTVMSKRTLAHIVASDIVKGWDDPRMPTIRGLIRRGLTMPALREFIRSQGPSRNVIALDWSLLWSVNKKHIDPIAARHTAVRQIGSVVAFVNGITDTVVLDKPKHSKSKGLGTKKVVWGDNILLEQDDAQSLVEGEEITLMSWGNALVSSIDRDSTSERVTSLRLELNLAGNVKTTKKRLTWLSIAQKLVPVRLHSFGILITKEKFQKHDDVNEYINRDSEKVEDAWADCNVADLQRGEIIQFERYGYYRVDEPASAGMAGAFFKIPTIPRN